MNKTLITTLTLATLALLIVACDLDGDDGDEGGAAPAAPASTKNATSPATDPRCAPDGGYVDNACDSCENANCCSTRFACYDNASCDAANKAFDDCLTNAGKDVAAVKACWDTLSTSSSIAKARVDCQRSKCQAACEVP
jgi:hypothetical protein